MHYLEVIHKGGKQIYPLLEGKPIFIGRAKECTITLPSSAVSRRHAVILMKNGVCGIKDLGSFNGTLVNNGPLEAPSQLHDGDLVRISSFIIRVVIRSFAGARDPSATATARPGDSGVYPGSNLRLPRAMLAKEAVNKLIGDIMPNPDRTRQDGPEDTQVYTAGADTTVLMREQIAAAAAGRPNLVPIQDVDGITFTDGDSPDGTIVEPPSDEFREPSPSESDFHEPVRDDIPPVEDAAPEEEPLVNPEEAEALIPLIEPEATPLLVLDQDETTLALEKLIEDTPPRRWVDPGAAADEAVAASGPASGPEPETEKPATTEVEAVPYSTEEPLPRLGSLAPDDGVAVATGYPDASGIPDAPVDADGLEDVLSDEPVAVTPIPDESAVDEIAQDDSAVDDDVPDIDATLPEGVFPEPSELFEEDAEAVDAGMFDGGIGVTFEDAGDGADAPGDAGDDNAPGPDEPNADADAVSRSTTTIRREADPSLPRQTGQYMTNDTSTRSFEAAADTGDYESIVPVGIEGELDGISYSGFDETDQSDEAERSSQSRHTTTYAVKQNADGVDCVPVPPSLSEAIETRLTVYSLLEDLEEERRMFRSAVAGRDAVATAALDSQSAELEDLPTSDEADRLIQEMQAKHETEDDILADGSGNRPPEYTPERRRAEEMALTQWHLIRDSHRDTLPGVFKEAYLLSADEPLARELTRSRLSHGRLFGGALYLLALETMTEAAREENRDTTLTLRKLSEEGLDTGDTGILNRLGRIGKMAQNLRNRSLIRDEADRLKEREAASVRRLDALRRESAFVEKFLIREFRSVYLRVALHYIPGSGEMPVPVRAFLRHGVIGFKSWWLKPEMRNWIITDCQDDVVTTYERSSGDLNILYADEYLGAVARMDCPPSPDEHLATLEKNSDQWKTERAYRRIVNARGYNELLQEMIANLGERVTQLQHVVTGLEAKLAQDRDQKSQSEVFDIQTEIQNVTIRKTNFEKYINRIENEVVASIIESVQEAEGRFRKGELRMPDEVSLLKRECRSIAEISRHLAGQKERFVPLLLRGSDIGQDGTVNDRAVVRKLFLEQEERDPGIFMNTIIPARKRENRVEFRLSPVIVLVPVAGIRCHCALAREGMEGGHLFLPTVFAKEGIRPRRFLHLFADYRWESSRNFVGRDLINSDSLVGAFTRIRWEWRNHPKQRREKGLIFSDLSEIANWRRVYEVLSPDAALGCRNLFLRNQELYEAIIGKYIDLPAGVKLIRQRT